MSFVQFTPSSTTMCLYNITPIIIYTSIFTTNACAIRNGGFCESRRHICRSYNLHPHKPCCVNKISHQKPFPSWRRYTFLRVRLRNQRFLPHPQKNWSPLRAACAYLYINYIAFTIVYVCVRIRSGMAYWYDTHKVDSLIN